MDMIDLVLTVCLIANPAECHEEHLYFESHGSLVQCTFLAPPQIARWALKHPKFQIARWKCSFPDKGREI
nr:hypothetical protein [Mesorhizobium shangrilense]